MNFYHCWFLEYYSNVLFEMFPGERNNDISMKINSLLFAGRSFNPTLIYKDRKFHLFQISLISSLYLFVPVLFFSLYHHHLFAFFRSAFLYKINKQFLMENILYTFSFQSIIFLNFILKTSFIIFLCENKTFLSLSRELLLVSVTSPLDQVEENRISFQV